MRSCPILLAVVALAGSCATGSAETASGPSAPSASEPQSAAAEPSSQGANVSGEQASHAAHHADTPAASTASPARASEPCASCEERKAHRATQTAPPPAATETSAAATYTGPDPCRHALKGKTPVALACSKGGIKEAKAVMKAMVKQGKAAGLKFTCDDCHTDPDDFTKFASDATEKFEKLLAVYKP